MDPRWTGEGMQGRWTGECRMLSVDELASLALTTLPTVRGGDGDVGGYLHGIPQLLIAVRNDGADRRSGSQRRPMVQEHLSCFLGLGEEQEQNDRGTEPTVRSPKEVNRSWLGITLRSYRYEEDVQNFKPRKKQRGPKNEIK